jgi:hypothetical protein
MEHAGNLELVMEVAGEIIHKKTVTFKQATFDCRRVSPLSLPKLICHDA